jgi:hypothetical protein
MRWKKVVIGAVLGGLLGFGGQMCVDFFCWKGPYNSETPCEVICSPDLHLRMATHWPVSTKLEPYRNWLICEGEFIWWLLHRGEVVSKSSTIAAFLGASAAFAVEQRKKQSTGKNSIQPANIAANPVAEPKDNASEEEPVEKPAQMEMTEQATVLKTAPKKEHAEA